MVADDMCNYLHEVRAIAADAGRRILQVYGRDFSTTKKADGSPLTEADRAANHIILMRLGRLAPAIPVLSEESAVAEYPERAAWKRFWLVDPLDGTREFIKRNGEFTVNIALIEGNRPLLGVVHVPVTGVTYFACHGHGAFKQTGGLPAQPLHVRAYTGGRATVATSRSHAGDSLLGFLARLAAEEGEYEIIGTGSSIKLCLIAEGRADVYPRFGPTWEWDTAAGQCIVEVSGGRVVDAHNHNCILVYNKPSLLNPWFIVTCGGDYDWTRYLETNECKSAKVT